MWDVRHLAVFTREGSEFGHRYLRTLAARGVMPHLLVVERTAFARRLRMARFLAGKIGWIDAARYNLRCWHGILNDSQLAPPVPYERYAHEVLRTGNVNEDRVVQRLEGDDRIRRVALAHSSVIRSRILGIPRIRVINAHPAILPLMRGVDVVRWSLYTLAPLGATLHFVERGIDTGGIIRRARYTVRSRDTIRTIEEGVNAAAVGLLADASLDPGLDAGPLERQSPEDGIQHYLMPVHLRKQLEKQFERIKLYYLVREQREEGEPWSKSAFETIHSPELTTSPA